MSNRINAYRPAHFRPTRKDSSQDASQETTKKDASQKTSAREAAEAQRTAREAASREARLQTGVQKTASQKEGALSSSEQQMIDRFFPKDPDLSMRIYGPKSDERSVNPSALGRRLDVSG